MGKGGEARYIVTISGDEIAGAGRFVHVPEAWMRAEEERDNRLQVVGLAAVVVFFAPGLPRSSSASSACQASRRCALAWIVFAVTLVIAMLSAANNWPSLAMRLLTTEPVASQLTAKILGGVAAALLGGLLAGLCAGVGSFGARMTPPLDRIGRWPAVLAAIAAGAFVVGLQAALGALATPDVPRWPSSSWQSQAFPLAGGVLSGLGFMGFASLELFVVYVVARLTRGFSERRGWRSSS